MRRTIAIRTFIASILVIVRGSTAVFAPNLFLGSDLFVRGTTPVGMYPVASIILARGALTTIYGLGYFISLWSNRYFFEWCLVCMVLGCAVLWRDIELYGITQMATFTTLSLALMSMRIIIVALPSLNYLDI